MTTVQELLDAMRHQIGPDGQVVIDGRNNWIEILLPVQVRAIHQTPFGPTTVDLRIGGGWTEIAHINIDSIAVAGPGSLVSADLVIEEED